MEAWFQGLSLIQKVFALCAIAGGTIFVLRALLLLAGVGHDLDSDVDVHSGLGDSDVSFHFLTLTGITAFFLMFGLAGLTIMKKANSPVWLAVLAGIAAGLLTMWMIALIFKGMRKLSSEGTIVMGTAVGMEGVAYLNIPSNGIGKVQITIQAGLKIFDARSDEPAPIKTGDRVKVVGVTPENMLIVQKL